MATASMPCSPPPAITSLFSCAGWRGFCAPCSRRSPQHRRRFAWPKNRRSAVLHGRLVSNFSFDHSEINGFELPNGNFRGTIQINTGGMPGGLWSLDFGVGGNNGDPDTLYFTDGINGEVHGLFGAISHRRGPPGTDD